MNRGVMAQHAGFTLLEVLLAVSLFALVAVGAITAMTKSVDSQEIIYDNEERLTQLQKGFFRIERDLMQAVPRTIVDPFGAYIPAFYAPEGGANGLGAYFEFTRSGWDDLSGRLPRSNMQRVAYRLKEDVLEKLVWLELDRTADSEPYIRELITGVQRMELRFWDGGESADWPKYWPKDPLAEKNIELPYVLELTIETTDLGEIKRLFRLSAEPELAKDDSNGRNSR